jgi:hypothetical protein
MNGAPHCNAAGQIHQFYQWIYVSYRAAPRLLYTADAAMHNKMISPTFPSEIEHGFIRTHLRGSVRVFSGLRMLKCAASRARLPWSA